MNYRLLACDMHIMIVAWLNYCVCVKPSLKPRAVFEGSKQEQTMQNNKRNPNIRNIKKRTTTQLQASDFVQSCTYRM